MAVEHGAYSGLIIVEKDEEQLSTTSWKNKVQIVSTVLSRKVGYFSDKARIGILGLGW